MQTDPLAVDRWEFQYSLNGTAWHWVQQAQPVDGCVDCFQAVITIPDQTVLVRMRAEGITGTSGWSDVRYLPEPEMTTWLIPLLILLIAAATRRAKTR